MTYTVTSPFGALFYSALAPWQNDAVAILAEAVGTMFDPVYALTNQVGDDGDTGFIPSWGTLFDVDLCPTYALPYLAQYVGVQIPAGASDATARSLTRQEAGMARGTYGAMQSAVVRSISTVWAPNTAYVAGVLVATNTPAGVVYYQVTTSFTSASTFTTANLAVIDPTTQFALLERTTLTLGADAYQMLLVVRPEQLTPVNDTTAVTANVTATKPGGIILNVIAEDSPRWLDATKAWNAVAGSVTWATVLTGDV